MDSQDHPAKTSQAAKTRKRKPSPKSLIIKLDDVAEGWKLLSDFGVSINTQPVMIADLGDNSWHLRFESAIDRNIFKEKVEMSVDVKIIRMFIQRCDTISTHGVRSQYTHTVEEMMDRYIFPCLIRERDVTVDRHRRLQQFQEYFP